MPTCPPHPEARRLGDDPVAVDLALEVIDPAGEVGAFRVEEERSHLIPRDLHLRAVRRSRMARSTLRAEALRMPPDSPAARGSSARGMHRFSRWRGHAGTFGVLASPRSGALIRLGNRFLGSGLGLGHLRPTTADVALALKAQFLGPLVDASPMLILADRGGGVGVAAGRGGGGVGAGGAWAACRGGAGRGRSLGKKKARRSAGFSSSSTTGSAPSIR